MKYYFPNVLVELIKPVLFILVKVKNITMTDTRVNQIGVTFIMLLFFILGLVATASAQEIPRDAGLSVEEKAEMLTQQLEEKLQLEVDQADTIYQINVAFINQIEEIRGMGRSLENRKKLKALHEQRNTDLEEILDKDQFALFKEIQAENRAKIKEARKNRKEKNPNIN